VSVASASALDLLRPATASFTATPVTQRPGSADPTAERAPATWIERNLIFLSLKSRFSLYKRFKPPIV